MIGQQKLDAIVRKNNSLVCVGLDSDIRQLPQHLRSKEFPQFEFNKLIIEATHDLVCAYKPNIAFYEAAGTAGLEQLKMTCDFIRKTYPGVFLILDAKRADIGSTNEGYVQYIFDYLGADAITLHPYLGSEALKPFLERSDKVSIILCRTSNPGAGELQDLELINKTVSNSKTPNKLYQLVANNVAKMWNKNNNCMLVVGATYPEELSIVRTIIGEMTILIPGIGAQGGDLESTVKAGRNSKNEGIIVSSSRAIIFASSGTDCAEAARRETDKLRKQINSI